MSDTKEYSTPELIEGLDIIISACVTTKKKQVIGNQILSLLIDIKGVLKQLVQQPQPDEELVEKIIREVGFIVSLDGEMEEAIRVEIRKLLPPKPSVTREEIVMFWGGNLGTFIKLLESKGIEVKGEK